MVLKVFTKEDYSETTQAKELGDRLKSEGFNVEYFDADDKTAIQQTQLYDIYSYPSFVVARDDGSEIKCWRGKVPLYDDVLSFLNR